MEKNNIVNSKKKTCRIYRVIGLLVLLLATGSFTVWAQSGLEYKTCPSDSTINSDPVPTDIAVDVVFNQDIALVTTDGITMTAGSGTSIDFQPRIDQYVLWLRDPWNSENPESPLPAGDTITVHLPKECVASAQDDTHPGQDIDFSFKTAGDKRHFLSNFVTPVATQTAQNHPPVANSDSYTVETGNTLTVDKPGVLVNDTDADGDTLTAVLVTNPTHGSLTQNADGSLTYTPSSGFTGNDTYTYKANDGKVDSNNTAIVTITVTSTSSPGTPAQNHPPVANPDSYSIETGKTLNVDKPGVLANDTDVDGDTLTAILVTNPSHGTLTQKTDGSLTYAPNPGFSGTDTYTYKANDGKADSNTATVTIKVTSVQNVSGGDEGPTPSGDNTSEPIQVPELPNVTTPNHVPGPSNPTIQNKLPAPTPVVVTPKMPNTGVDPADPAVGWPVPAGICLAVLFIVMVVKSKGLFSSCK